MVRALQSLSPFKGLDLGKIKQPPLIFKMTSKIREGAGDIGASRAKHLIAPNNPILTRHIFFKNESENGKIIFRT